MKYVAVFTSRGNEIKIQIAHATTVANAKKQAVELAGGKAFLTKHGYILNYCVPDKR